MSMPRAGSRGQACLKKSRARPNAPRAALYLRVSTDRQTIENQEIQLRQVAERRGWEVRSKRCDDRVVRGQIRRSASADHPTGDMTERDLSYPWPRVPQETETSNRRHRPVQHRAGSKARGAPMPSRPPQPRRSPQMPAELRCTFLPNRSGTAGVLALCSQLVDCVSPRQRSDQTMRPASPWGAKYTVTFIDCSR